MVKSWRLRTSTECRLGIEIEFAVVDLGHVGQPASERIETNDAGVHLRNPQRQGIERIAFLASNRIDLGQLLLEVLAELRDLAAADAGARVRRIEVTARETDAAEHGDDGQADQARGQPGQVPLPGLAQPLAEDDDVHRVSPDCALIELLFAAPQVGRLSSCIDLQSSMISVAPLS